ncbi:MAG TPA: DUF6443 domain-containing protein [Chitinophagaceae bacterium]
MLLRKQATASAAFYLIAFFSIISANSQVTPPAAYAGTVKVNYIRVWDAVKPTSNPNDLTVSTGLQDAKMTTQYYDGLGRSLQIVSKQGSLETGGTAKDLVSTVLYDEFGREVYKYIPFAANNTGGNTSLNDGFFKLNPFQQQASFAASQFPTDSFFYGKINYEASPLNRILNSYAPGDSWAGSESAGSENNRHSIAKEYLINTALDSVRIWDVNSSGVTSTPSIYLAGVLYKTTTIDENKKKIIEYKDKEGRLVLRKVQISDSPAEGHTGWLCTYYVYDDLNSLRLVIPPKATKELAASSWTLTSTILDELCFRYEYDERLRPIVKKLPGAAEIRMVYDARDRMVLSQDGNQRGRHEWLYTQYDNLNRPIVTGYLTDPTNYDNHEWHLGQAYNSTNYPNLGSYTHVELTGTFYDDYSWRSTNGNPLSDAINTANNSYLLSPNDNVWPYPQAVSKSIATQNLITGSRVKILGTSDWLYTVNIYDDKGRLIQVQSQNVTDGTSILTSQYNWSGQPLMVINSQEKDGANSQTTVQINKFTYDTLGRLVKVEKKISHSTIASGSMPGSWTTISSIKYDALGQIVIKELGNDPLETLHYDYNIRGWTLGMNRDFVKDVDNNRYFGFELGYDNTGTIINGSSYSTAQFNGNISGTVWKSKGDNEKRKYDFSYDASNRLLMADFNQYTSGTFNKTAGIDFTVKMGDGLSADSAYDYNGNILRMQQWGLAGFSSSRIDDLKYTYSSSSNKLKNTIDSQNEPTTVLGDFRSSQSYMTSLGGTKTSSAVDYVFDDNGNMTKDRNKDIDDNTYDGIEYNLLNLPTKIRVKNKGTIEFIYDASGNKLSKTVKETGKPDKTTLYLSGIIYENDTLQLITHEEGRIRPVGDSILVYDFFIKDHLGNVRMVLTKETPPGALYQATMETGSRTVEEQLFTQISETAASKPGGFDSEGSNSYVSKLFNASGNDKRVGTGVVLKVMAGDKFRAGVKGWYQPGSTNFNELPGASSIITALIGAFTGGMPVGGGHGTGGVVPGSGELSTPLTSFITNNNNPSGSRPKAFLNWIILDEQQFKLVADNYGAVQIPEITGLMEKQTMVANGGNDIEVKKNGYLYVYVSNESQGNVYFDDLSVVHTRGTLLEETHYYPFGLTMAGISSKALNFGNPANKAKFNGIEQSNDFDLNMYDAFYRNLDPQIGRFWQIDPKPLEMASPYSAMLNNPILFSDPLGDTTWVYNQNGVFCGVVNDKLKNQIHFINTEGDPGTPFDASSLSAKDAKALGKAFRGASFAFVGSKTVADMEKIAGDADKKGFELGFVANISESKEIRLTALPDKYATGDRTYDLIKAIDDTYTKEQQAGLFAAGHVHNKKHTADVTGYDGYTGIMAKLLATNRPSTTNGSEKTYPDFQPFLYRYNASTNSYNKGQTPAFIISAYGACTYGTGTGYGGLNNAVQNPVKPNEYNSYNLYQQLKR